MASGNMKDIKRRIKSVQSTMQITKAMELVASSKLRRAKERTIQSRPYFNTVYNTMATIASQGNVTSPYSKKRDLKKSTFIVIAGDRGLAGGYNSNIFKLAMSSIKDKEDANVIAIGKKAIDYFEKRPYEVVEKFLGIAESLRMSDTVEIVSRVMEMYKKGETDEVFLFFTQFISPIQQEPTMLKLLPLELGKKETEGQQMLTEYDPSPEAVLENIIPEYLAGVIYGAIVESYASEQGARRTAMESASDNAGEMIDSLNLSYNRARQAAITQELTEIVAGSGAIN